MTFLEYVGCVALLACGLMAFLFVCRCLDKRLQARRIEQSEIRCFRSDVKFDLRSIRGKLDQLLNPPDKKCGSPDQKGTKK